MQKRILIYAAVATGWLAACKKDDKPMKPVLPVPVVTSVNHQALQAGDTLVITGQHLLQSGKATEVLIGQRNLQVLSSTDDNIRALVPASTLTGPLTLYVGEQTLQWEPITVFSTPVVTAYAPLLVSAGDTIYLTGEHFAPKLEDNHITLGSRAVKVVSVSDKLLKAILPEDSDKDALHYQTYTGPVYTFKDTVGVRLANYPSATVMDWLRQDPGFSRVYAYLQEVRNDDRYTRAVDTLYAWLNGERTGTMFIPNNNYENFGRPLFPMLGAATYASLSYDELATDVQYPSVLINQYVFTYMTNIRRHYFVINMGDDGRKWLQPLALNGAAPVRIGRQRKIGGIIFYELDALPAYDPEFATGPDE